MTTSKVKPSHNTNFALRNRICFLFVFLLAASAFGATKDAVKNLPAHYREWLNKDVAYIISNQEKEAFLQLPDDAARDRFMERFWEVRNPTPGAPDNSYKIEHYRRIEYSTQFFGHASHTEGWRTDMGRVYITLGEPSQRQKLLGLQKVTPMEIWFYSNSNPALPPFFYVVFYQRDSTSEFKLYSPYSDGPEKLITSVVGPSRADALKIISQDAGRDVAKETMSLLTNEPVDLESGTISLQSDVMLSTIRDLANNPISKRALEVRRQALEDVSHRIILDEFLDVAAVPLRDSSGNVNLHYLMRLKKPEDFTIAKSPKSEGFYYAVLIGTKIWSAEGKLVWSEEKKISRNLSQAQFDGVKGKIFGYEGLLPLPAHQYKIEFQLTNLISATAYRRELEIKIPDPTASALQITPLIPFADAGMINPETSGALPFSGAGVKFIPIAGQELVLTQGQPLKFFYQIWAGAGSRSGKLEAEYAYGRMGAHDTQTVREDISLEQMDPAGSMLNGKRIPTGELEVGNYRLSLTVRDPEKHDKAFGSLNFSVTTAGTSLPAWDISDEHLADDAKNGSSDFQRGTIYQALGDAGSAESWFKRAHEKNLTDERFRTKLIDLYFAQGSFARVVDLYSQKEITSATDQQTILKIAQSLEAGGNLKQAVAVMESGVNLNPSSGPLFLGLAQYYRKVGDETKAAAAERKGKEFTHPAPQT